MEDAASAYGEDLAYVHEHGFADVAQAAARELRTRLAPPARVVDLGCGGGTLAHALAPHGYAVWGIDASPSMVELARQKEPRARFDVADALAVRLPECDAVTLVGEVLNYALVDRPLGAADGFFTRVHAALRPGGLFLFDVATTTRSTPPDHVAERSGEGWRVRANVTVHGDRLQRTIETWRRQGDSERHAQEVHRQRLLRAEWVQERLEAAGFAVESIGGYDDLPFEEGWDAFAATRTP